MVQTRFKQTCFRAQILKIDYHCPPCCASFQNPQLSLAENKLLFQPHTAALCSGSGWKLQNSYGGACPESLLLVGGSDVYYPGVRWGSRGERCVHTQAQDIKACTGTSRHMRRSSFKNKVTG